MSYDPTLRAKRVFIMPAFSTDASNFAAGLSNFETRAVCKAAK